MEKEINEWDSELDCIKVSLEYTWRTFSRSFDKHLQLTEVLHGGKHAAVRVGAATTNLQMLKWSNK